MCLDGSVCIKCVASYIIHPDHKIECMICHREFHIDFVWNTFSEDTFYKVLEKKQNMLLDQQKSLLPSTMPLVEDYLHRLKLTEEYKALDEIRLALENQLIVVETKMNNLEHDLNSSSYDKNAIYEFHCPNHDCKGYIKTGTLECTLCKTKICKKCHAIRTVKHKCTKSDIATANMIKKDTKPCPKCAARIHKIEGCSQMYCTACKTAFDWNSGRIETGVIHNPHFYDEQRDAVGPIRVMGDIPCGGLEYPIFELMDILPQDIFTKYINLYTRTAEIQDYMLNLNRNPEITTDTLANVRIKYIIKEISDEDFKQASYDALIAQEVAIDEREILNTYLACMIERHNSIGIEARTMVDGMYDIEDPKIIRKTSKNIAKYMTDMLDGMDIIFDLTKVTLWEKCEKELDLNKPFYKDILYDNVIGAFVQNIINTEVVLH